MAMHNALKLEHDSDGTFHYLGYQAFCAARQVVAKAAAIMVHTSGEVDVHGRRLICSTVTTNWQGRLTYIGESCVCGSRTPSECHSFLLQHLPCRGITVLNLVFPHLDPLYQGHSSAT